MPEKVTNRSPYSADIVVRREAHQETVPNDKGNGYPVTVNVEGGVLLSIKLSADTLPNLIKKIEGHVGLIE
jgi:hypothetical protein